MENVVKHVYKNLCCESTVLQVVLKGNFYWMNSDYY